MKKWVVNKSDTAAAKKLSIECNVDMLCAEVLVSRGITSSEHVEEYFNIEELSDPFLLKDMERAAELINEAVDNYTSVCIYGDYDCDGICSTVMLFSYLECMGANVSYILPERDDGYGLNKEAVKKMHDRGVELIITVDNGISAVEEAELVYELGMKLIITDHHQPGNILPKAEAIVDPHREDCKSPFKHLCGAGVVLKLIAAAEGGSYDTALNEYGELAALATIADIVSLTGENRYIVKYGMQLMENSERAGVNTLISKSGLRLPVTSTSIAFGLAPRINAAGRLGSPSLAARLLITDDEEEAQMLAEELEKLNSMRKDKEKDIIEDIERMISDNPDIALNRVLVLSGKKWHHGVIGIVAARIQEHFGKPCFIITIDGDTAKGSARAFGDFSVFKALEYCSDILLRFGGHPGAGGFTVETSKIPEFTERLQKFASENFKYMPALEITADKLVSISELTVESIDALKVLEPFGEGSSQPVFAIGGCTVRNLIPLSGGAHTKIQLECGGKQFDALIFRISPDKLFIKKDNKIDIMFTAETQVYAGQKSVSIFVRDFRLSGMEQQKYFAAKDAYEKYRRNEPLPPAYYERMCPDRSELIAVYSEIKQGNNNIDTLSMKYGSVINYSKTMICIDIFRELGLVSCDYFSNEVHIIKGAPFAPLEGSLVLKDIREKCPEKELESLLPPHLQEKYRK